MRQVERLRQSDGSAGPWLVLDGAHTPAAAAGLSNTLRAVFPDAALAFVVAMAADKDAAGVMTELRKARPDVMVFTSTPIAGSTSRCAPCEAGVASKLHAHVGDMRTPELPGACNFCMIGTFCRARRTCSWSWCARSSVFAQPLALYVRQVNEKRLNCRSMASGQLLAQWQAANMAASDAVLRSRDLMSPSVMSAVERAKQQLLSHGANAVICITGSLHAVASVLSSSVISRH